MQLVNSVVVITGAGRGIGAALSRKFADQGATVVVNDLDEAAARQVAADVGGFAVPGDAASEVGAQALVDATLAQYGQIDMFCANAGVAPAGGPEAAEELWSQAWEVNVMAHVRAARAVLPHWLERGSGHFLATVSAAGLLTMLGSAPYAVSKHGALAFAEWLSVTYADRGVTVQALCPQGVRTDMLDGTGEVGRRLLADGAVEPEQVAEAVVDSLQDKPFLILPHPEVADYYARRAGEPDRWLANMRKLQRHLDQA